MTQNSETIKDIGQSCRVVAQDLCINETEYITDFVMPQWCVAAGLAPWYIPSPHAGPFN